MRPPFASIIAGLLLAASCGDSGSAQPAHPVANNDPTPAPARAEPAALEPIAQDPGFPLERWVRTQTFDGRELFGFTYTDPSKGNSIKGEVAGELSDEELSKKLNGTPSMTLSPIPAGHTVVPLTDPEIEILKLPPEPDWLSFYKQGAAH